MQLTRYTDYGLRTLIYLALKAESAGAEALSNIGEISERYDISRNHMTKVVNELGQRGYIETIRGKQGGIRLATAAKDINVGSVIRQLEHNLTVIDCHEPPCAIKEACKLQGILFEALEAFLKYLDQYSLDQLLTPQQDLQQFLGIPIKTA